MDMKQHEDLQKLEIKTSLIESENKKLQYELDKSINQVALIKQLADEKEKELLEHIQQLEIAKQLTDEKLKIQSLKSEKLENELEQVKSSFSKFIKSF